MTRGSMPAAVRVLLLLVIPLAVQLARPVVRLDSDAVEYYAHLRSLVYDHDVDFTNEFAHFGILERWDKGPLTATGLRRTNFSVGPGYLAGGDGLPGAGDDRLEARLRRASVQRRGGEGCGPVTGLSTPTTRPSTATSRERIGSISSFSG